MQVVTEVERAQDLIRSALRALVAVSKVEGATQVRPASEAQSGSQTRQPMQNHKDRSASSSTHINTHAHSWPDASSIHPPLSRLPPPSSPFHVHKHTQRQNAKLTQTQERVLSRDHLRNTWATLLAERSASSSAATGASAAGRAYVE